MSSKPEVVVTVLLACLTLAAFMAAEPAPAVGQAPNEPSQQVTPAHEFVDQPGPGRVRFPFLTVYLWKEGDWDKDDCIKVFPDPAVISFENHPTQRIWWVILERLEDAQGKETGWSVDHEGKYEWSIKPKTAGDDLVPPPDKKIEKGNNSFRSGKPSDKGYWKYKIKVTDKDSGKSCTLDPEVQIKG